MLRTGLIVATALALTGAAYAKPLPRYGAFVFSSLCMESESGDPAGYRVAIIRLADGDSGAFEWSEGGLERAPIDRLTIDKAGHIALRYMDDAVQPPEPKDLGGAISDEALDFDIAGKPVHLPRLRDFSQAPPACGAKPVAPKPPAPKPPAPPSPAH
jgi:hypothetical protein